MTRTAPYFALLMLASAQGVSADGNDDSLPPPPMGTTRAYPVAPAPSPPTASETASQPTLTRVPYAPESLLPEAPVPRNAAVDRAGATRLSAQRDDMPTFSVFVEGSRGPPRTRPMTLEQRFAAAFDNPAPTLASRLAGNTLESAPCPKLSSPGTPFGPAYNPFLFCP